MLIRIRPVAMMAGIVLIASTEADAYRIAAVPTQHIVMLDANGRLMDPTGSSGCEPQKIRDQNERFVRDNPNLVRPPLNYTWHPCNGAFSTLAMRALRKRDRDDYIDDLLAEMDDFFASRPDPHAPREVVLIVHGGLDTNKGNLERVQAIAQFIRNDGKYPIFILWQANLWRSLLAHLFTVRQGDYEGPKSAPLFPIFLVADLGRGLVRAPIVWWYMLENDIDRVRRSLLNRRARSDDAYCDLREQWTDCNDRRGPCDVVDISKGPFRQERIEGAESVARYSSTGTIPVRGWAHLLHNLWHGIPTHLGLWSILPVRYLLAPFVDGLGTPAWNEMQRHALLGFHGPGEATSYSIHGEGGLGSFFTALKKHLGCDGTGSTCTAGWNITLIGHSMGTIVANQVLREFPELPIDQIVYMAAACSVRDYEDSVIPFLKAHQNTNMHHLLLHDFAEIRDQYAIKFDFLELAPSGSLLVWIDNYFTTPSTLRDRTAGRFDNLLLFLGDTPESVRKRVHVKTFGVGRKIEPTDPQHHGSFNDFDCADHEDGPHYGKFWDEKFWQTEAEDRITYRPACLLREY